jgi:hypothetical protein
MLFKCCAVVNAAPADLDDPDELELQQQALEAAAAELHAARDNTRYWTDYLQVWPCGIRSNSFFCTRTVFTRPDCGILTTQQRASRICA